MDKFWKYRIIQALRRLSFSYPPRNNAKRNAKVDKATYECNMCGVYIYDGKSDKNFKELESQHKNIIRGKTCIDHVTPVRDSGVGFTWDAYVEGLFCEESNFQVLCSQCHDTKTKKENKIRVRQRKK